MKIQYKEFEMTCPDQHVKDAVEALSTSKNRPEIVKSVNTYIETHLPSMADGSASQDVAMRVMQDIAIWYANEVVEERATLGMVH